MQYLLVAVGVVLILVGLVFAIRGVGSDRGTGNLKAIKIEGPAWLILVVVGVGLIVFSSIHEWPRSGTIETQTQGATDSITVHTAITAQTSSSIEATSTGNEATPAAPPALGTPTSSGVKPQTTATAPITTIAQTFSTSWNDFNGRPVAWPNGEFNYFPQSAIDFDVPENSKLVAEITVSPSFGFIDGMQCDKFDPSDPTTAQFVGAYLVLDQTTPLSIMGNQGEEVRATTGVLSPGHHTVGIAAKCAPPDAVGDPDATYYLAAAEMALKLAER